MSLILKILSFKNQPVTAIESVAIGNGGGSIGRADDNTLVLPDAEKFVSRHHATISVENGRYYLSDTSLGGITINGQETPLHNATERIDDGTLLKIGEYEIAVVIVDDPGTDDFPFVADSITPEPKAFRVVDEPWVELEDGRVNSLMTDNFPRHEELVQPTTDAYSADFESRLQGNHSPLFDSYIAPDIIPPSSPAVAEEIPENFSFDDLFSAPDGAATSAGYSTQTGNQPAVHDDFEDFFAAAVSDIGSETVQTPFLASETPTENKVEISDPVDLFADKTTLIEPLQSSPSDEPATIALASGTAAEDGLEFSQASGIFADNDAPIELPLNASTTGPTATTINGEVFTESRAIEWGEESIPSFAAELSVFASENPPAVTVHESGIHPEGNKINTEVESVEESTGGSHISKANVADSVLFDVFLQGAAVENTVVAPGQQAETLRRIGQMFRKLIDGTVAVLRSRAEFKSLCRVNMTIIRSANNNPLKFTVSTDEVLRQLLENKTEGFLGATAAIDEAFTDIMNHQLAMQAGLQASLTDLLKTFDPKIIEKHFEQGIVLQKKAKCWDRYEEIYRTTAEEAVENFFGDEFVRAYEQQMSLLKKSRKRQDE